jgi:hypothetical protein
MFPVEPFTRATPPPTINECWLSDTTMLNEGVQCTKKLKREQLKKTNVLSLKAKASIV